MEPAKETNGKVDWDAKLADAARRLLLQIRQQGATGESCIKVRHNRGGVTEVFVSFGRIE